MSTGCSPPPSTTPCSPSGSSGSVRCWTRRRACCTRARLPGYSPAAGAGSAPATRSGTPEHFVSARRGTLRSGGAMAAACNRVTPTGEIEAFGLRGAFTGNRGILHSGRSIVRFHGHNCWITCALTFNDRWNEQWRPHRFTWLYFYDEALSFAAGHRPCAECRWRSYTAYRRAWSEALGVEP